MRSILLNLFLPLAALVLSLAANATSGDAPKVLVSIKPLQMIAAALTDGITEPDVLLEPGTSPHDYSMKPSDVKKIANADFIFWVGEDLERFLEKPLDRFSNTFSVLAVMDAPGVKIRKFSETNEHDEHESREVHHKGHHEHDHDHGNHDPHVWLAPENALAIAKAMEKSLIAEDKNHAEVYQANYRKFEKQVNAVDQRSQQILKPLADKGFFVFHDAWGYFTDHHNLRVAGIFTLSPEQQPGARHMLDIRKKLAAEGDTCLFREPQFQPAYLATHH